MRWLREQLRRHRHDYDAERAHIGPWTRGLPPTTSTVQNLDRLTAEGRRHASGSPQVSSHYTRLIAVRGEFAAVNVQAADHTGRRTRFLRLSSVRSYEQARGK